MVSSLTIRTYIKTFFLEPASPVSLALFRITLFTILLSFDLKEALNFSRFPIELSFPPVGTSWLVDYVPINEAWVSPAIFLFRLSCLLGLIGLWTRSSCLISTLLGFYILGIAQLFGKVNHYHYLIWFLMLLTASRSGDFFSLDALFASWRNADKGVTEPPKPSIAYTLPIRFIWILIGLIYFFPGFWKLCLTNTEWLSGARIKSISFSHWTQINNVTPILRIDQYPLLCQLSGLGTLLLESTFIVLVFFPSLRAWAAIIGISFHTIILLLLNINFTLLQTFYLVFIRWDIMFNRMGQWIYKKKLDLVYDNNCVLCRRVIASIRVFDIFGMVTYEGRPDATSNFPTYRSLVLRVPILWPLLPFLYGPMSDISRQALHAVHSRQMQLPNNLPNAPTPKTHWPIILTGSFLILINSTFGFMKIENGWPFACFPTFTKSAKYKKNNDLRITVVSANDKETIIPLRTLQDTFSKIRYNGMKAKILSIEDHDKLRPKLNALWKVLGPKLTNTRSIKAVRFYRTTPVKRRGNEPASLREELLLEISI